MSNLIVLLIPKAFTPPIYGEVIEYRGLKYWIGGVIGQGAFGSVYDCTDEWGNPLPAKVLFPQVRSYEDVRADWLQELIKLQQLRHPRITFIYQAFEYQGSFYIIVEKCNFTLKEIITSPAQANSGDMWLPHISRDILNALHCIHEHEPEKKYIDIYGRPMNVKQQNPISLFIAIIFNQIPN